MMWMILADGIPWEDSEGKTEWTRSEASALAAMLEDPPMNYNVEMVEI